MGVLDTIKELSGIISSAHSAVVLADRLELFKDRLESIRESYIQLQEENRELVRQVEQCREQVAHLSVAAEYTEHGGAAFKRIPGGGGYENTAFCPSCHSAMASHDGRWRPLVCGTPKCGRKATIRGANVPRIIEELGRRDS